MGTTKASAVAEEPEFTPPWAQIACEGTCSFAVVSASRREGTCWKSGPPHQGHFRWKKFTLEQSLVWGM